MRQRISDFSDIEKTAGVLAQQLDPDASEYNRGIAKSACLLVRDGKAAWRYQSQGASGATTWVNPDRGAGMAVMTIVTAAMWKAG